MDALENAAFIRDEKQSPEGAKRWLDGLYEQLASLRDSPKRFPLIQESERFAEDLRSFNYHSHRIVYTIDEKNRLVTVLRIYHSARMAIEPEDIGL